MIIGHQLILGFLKRSFQNKRLAHSYLFCGPAHLGKKTVALEFIKMITGQGADQKINPDVLVIEPEITERQGVKKESEISIKQARQVQKQMSLSAYQSDYKIALIDQAEKMTSEASNCLLKTLEEPKGKAVLILITPNPKALLPTIVSRCQIVKFLPVNQKEIERGLFEIKKAGSKKLKQIVKLANGRPGLAIQYLENPELLEKYQKALVQLEKLLKSDLNNRYQYIESMAKDVCGAQEALNYWLFWFRDLLLLKVQCSDLLVNQEMEQYKNWYSLNKIKDIIYSIRKTSWLLTNPSLNVRLALEVLALEF